MRITTSRALAGQDPRESASGRAAPRARRHPRRRGTVRRSPPLLAALVPRVSEQHRPMVARDGSSTGISPSSCSSCCPASRWRSRPPGRNGSSGASATSHAGERGGSCRRTGRRSRSASPSPGGSSRSRPRPSRLRSPWSSTASSSRTSSARRARTAPSGRSRSRPSSTSSSRSFCFVRRRWGAAVLLASMTAIVVMTAADARRTTRMSTC